MFGIIFKNIYCTVTTIVNAPNHTKCVFLSTLLVLEFTQPLKLRRASLREFQTERRFLFYTIFFKKWYL